MNSNGMTNQKLIPGDIILSAQEIAELGLEEAPTEIGPSNEEATVASEKREAGHG